MTVNTSARAGKVTGAASHETVDWHAIDWSQTHRNVPRLQARIVKAVGGRDVAVFFENRFKKSPLAYSLGCHNLYQVTLKR